MSQKGSKKVQAKQDPMEVLTSLLKKDENVESEHLDPAAVIRAIYQIFGEQSEAPSFSPQAKIILLTILLCSTFLAMYTIFQSFIDTIILAMLSGISYVRLRERFVTFMKKSTIEALNTKSTFKICIQTVLYIALIVLIPWIRGQFSEVSSFQNWQQLLYSEVNLQLPNKILLAFFKTNNIIKLAQIYLFLQIMINFFGNTLQKVYFYLKGLVAKVLLSSSTSKESSKNKVRDFLHLLFLIAFFIGVIMVVLIFAGLFFEFSSMVSTAGKAIEKYNNCTFYSLDDDSNHTEQCSEAITGSLKAYLPKIEKKQDIAKCVAQIRATEERYLNFTLLEHKKEICLVYQMIKEYSPQAIDQIFDFGVTKEYLLTLFRHVLRLVTMTSDTIFSLTTFLSIFMVTVKSYTAAQQNVYLFGDHQNELLSQITFLIYDDMMVTVKHVIFSLVLFEIFRFSDFNIVLSLLIGTITLFPLISVTFIMIIFSLAKYSLTSESNYLAYLSNALCLLLFYIGSNHIFKDHYNKMDFNNTLISLSAVFGLYRFGVAGVFYGPLVILIFRCAYGALSKSKL